MLTLYELGKFTCVGDEEEKDYVEWGLEWIIGRGD